MQSIGATSARCRQTASREPPPGGVIDDRRRFNAIYDDVIERRRSEVRQTDSRSARHDDVIGVSAAYSCANANIVLWFVSKPTVSGSAGLIGWYVVYWVWRSIDELPMPSAPVLRNRVVRGRPSQLLGCRSRQ